jgi:LysM repeat protein
VPPLEYTVRNGDTPGRIALLYDLAVPELMTFNGKAEDDVIVVGEVLKIPPPTPQPTATTTAAPGTTTPPPANEIVYTVQAGDTLSGIALKFGVPMSRIQQRNKIQNIQSLQIGDQLVVPVAPTLTFTPGPGASSAGATTPTPQAQYPPVKLLTPLDREIFIGGSTPILSQWLSSGILQSNELYLVEVERPGAGSISASTHATSYPPDQYPAPGDTNRLFRWRVMIVQAGTGNDQSSSFRSALSANRAEWPILRRPLCPRPRRCPIASGGAAHTDPHTDIVNGRGGWLPLVIKRGKDLAFD